MKVLLSAYACEPNKGGEPGVGWRWAIEISRLGHEVWVLTRRNNKESIEAVLPNISGGERIHFIYYDLPHWLAWWKRGQRGIHLYYIMWQCGAYDSARRAHAEQNFDLVHHLTLGVVRHPSFMGSLGIPFILGPLGGGETSPPNLRKGFGFHGIFLETVRDFANWVVRIDPLMHQTFSKAKVIYTKTPETSSVIPRRYHKKVRLHVEIGIDAIRGERRTDEKSSSIFRVLFVGRFLYWKGMHLGIRAFAQVAKRDRRFRLTMIGSGPEEKYWKTLANELEIANRVEWISWLPQDALSAIYDAHDVLLFPSLHDSSGNVLLEAMSHGLPAICFNLGGPSMLANATCAAILDVHASDCTAVVDMIAERLHAISQDGGYRLKLAKGAKIQAASMSWSSRVGIPIYDPRHLAEAGQLISEL